MKAPELKCESLMVRVLLHCPGLPGHDQEVICGPIPMTMIYRPSDGWVGLHWDDYGKEPNGFFLSFCRAIRRGLGRLNAKPFSRYRLPSP